MTKISELARKCLDSLHENFPKKYGFQTLDTISIASLKRCYLNTAWKMVKKDIFNPAPLTDLKVIIYMPLHFCRCK